MNLTRLRRGLLAARFRYIAQNNKFLYYQVKDCTELYDTNKIYQKIIEWKTMFDNEHVLPSHQ